MSARYDDWFGGPDVEPPNVGELIVVIIILVLILLLWR